jgi:hypothetical protein
MSALVRAPAKFVGAVVPVFDVASGVYPLTTTHERVVAAFRAAGTDALDLAPPLGRFVDAERFDASRDELHLSAQGSRFAALAILDYLAAANLLPGIPPTAARTTRWADEALRIMAGWL